MEIVLTIVGILAVEAVAFIGYKLYKTIKEVEQLIKNVESLSECTLELAKRVQGVDVVEEYKNANDLHFPNSEGF